MLFTLFTYHQKIKDWEFQSQSFVVYTMFLLVFFSSKEGNIFQLEKIFSDFFKESSLSTFA